MLDYLCEHLCLRTRNEGWTSLEELNEILKRKHLHEKDAREMMDFLKKYFLEVDESEGKAKLSPWVHPLFEIDKV